MLYIYNQCVDSHIKDVCYNIELFFNRKKKKHFHQKPNFAMTLMPMISVCKLLTSGFFSCWPFFPPEAPALQTFCSKNRWKEKMIRRLVTFNSANQMKVYSIKCLELSSFYFIFSRTAHVSLHLWGWLQSAQWVYFSACVGFTDILFKVYKYTSGSYSLFEISSGVYLCCWIISNFVYVTDSAQAVDFFKPLFLSVRCGERVTLNCPFGDFHRTESVVWYKQNFGQMPQKVGERFIYKDIKISPYFKTSEFKMEMNDYGISLTIPHVNQQYAGLYYCEICMMENVTLSNGTFLTVAGN